MCSPDIICVYFNYTPISALWFMSSEACGAGGSLLTGSES